MAIEYREGVGREFVIVPIRGRQYRFPIKSTKQKPLKPKRRDRAEIVTRQKKGRPKHG